MRVTRNSSFARQANRDSGANQRGLSLFELLVVVAITLIAGAIAVPQINTMVRASRLASDAHGLAEEVTLAKMRAAANFTQARVHLDLAAGTYQLEVCTKNVTVASNNCTGTGYSWLNANGFPLEGPFPLSQGITAGLGGVGAAPPNTQPTLAQAPACLDSTGAAIGNSACIIFNSRGISIDGTATSQPTSNGAFYITNGNSVYAVTVTATGLIQTWRATVHGSGFSAL